MKWELIAQDSRFVCYRKGDKHDNLFAEFDAELKHIRITESMFIRNDTPMLEPQSDWIAHSAKYGHTQQMCPTLGMDDLGFIYHKAKEFFEVCAASRYCEECHKKIIEIVKQGGVADDVCEWKLTDTGKLMPYKTSCGNEDLYDNHYKYCPYCGKKISVIE